MDPQVFHLLTGGSAATVLVGLVVLILRGDLVTKRSAEDRVRAIKEGATALLSEVTASRDDWRKMAQDSIADVGQLGEALAVRNRIDEGVTKRIQEFESKVGA